MIIATLSLAAASVRECRVVNDDVIRMSDLAAIAPVFSRTFADEVVAYAPMPGSTRTLQAAQLARLAMSHGIADGDFHDVCFKRAMCQLSEHELLEAIRHTLDIPGAEVQLVDFSRFPIPFGDLVLPRSGLAFTPSTFPLLWKGYVVYGGGHRFPVWARVKIHVRLSRVVATDNLVTSKPVRADQVRIEPLDGVPDAFAPAQSIDQVVGKNLLRPLRSGATVSLDDVSTTVTVRRGDKVAVSFESGGISLYFEAAAEMDGRMGDRIRLRNPQSNSTFMAEVSGKDQARMVPVEEPVGSSEIDEETKDETNNPGAALRSAGNLRGDRQKEAQEGRQ